MRLKYRWFEGEAWQYGTVELPRGAALKIAETAAGEELYAGDVIGYTNAMRALSIETAVTCVDNVGRSYSIGDIKATFRSWEA